MSDCDLLFLPRPLYRQILRQICQPASQPVALSAGTRTRTETLGGGREGGRASFNRAHFNSLCQLGACSSRSNGARRKARNLPKPRTTRAHLEGQRGGKRQFRAGPGASPRWRRAVLLFSAQRNFAAEQLWPTSLADIQSKSMARVLGASGFAGRAERNANDVLARPPARFNVDSSSIKLVSSIT